MSEDKNNKLILGNDLFSKIASSRVLMVGAGGIGCELLKNLVLSGFKDFVVIDLDTIDISNLNRQFLFQRQHVKKSKAHVAKESALKFNPEVKIESHQANIKSAEYNVAWFKQFTMVLNALDNLDARKHVNAMCLAADVPLIESGTQGYLGQAYVIKKDATECFDCQPKETPKTYPVCTIRSTPSAPIHCIVWAKSYLFAQLFGNSEDDEAMEHEKSADNAQELAALAQETDALKKIKEAMGTPEYPKTVFTKIFQTDIERLLTMDDMWKTRQAPVPLDYAHLSKGRQVELTNELNDGVASPALAKGLQAQHIWTLGECFDVFRSSLIRLSERLRDKQSEKADATLEFDKDDDDALEFVAAAANLRAKVFGIKQTSQFKVKEMAGNIIPAIATTNAIIAGIVVMKAFDVIRGGNIGSIKRTYLKTVTRRPQLLMQETPSEPNPHCQVCQATSAVVLLDVEQATLRDLIHKVLVVPTDQGGMGMADDDLSVMEGDRMLYDIEYEDNLDTPLKDLHLKDGVILRIGSADGDEDVDLVINNSPNLEAMRLLEPVSEATKAQRLKRKRVLEELRVEEERESKKARMDDEQKAAAASSSSNGLPAVASSSSAAAAAASVVDLADDSDAIILLD